MAQYKVPQDVEADDKLLGPFSFRQFIYLIIVAALAALAWALFNIFPLLAVFPVPPALFLLVLALPLRKDQPMETYIAALISFYTKPNKRIWNPGQRETTVTITAPKTTEQPLTRDISEEEASRRLSFLATVVDSEGKSLRDGVTTTPTETSVRDEFTAEANAISDIYENYQSTQSALNLATESERHHTEVVEQMRAAIKANSPYRSLDDDYSVFSNPSSPASTPAPAPIPSSPSSTPASTPAPTPMPNPATKATPPAPPDPELIKLSKNSDFSIATIAQQANRDHDEVYISLH